MPSIFEFAQNAVVLLNLAENAGYFCTLQSR